MPTPFRLVAAKPINSGGVMRPAGHIIADLEVASPSDLALLARVLKRSPALRLLRSDGQPIGPADLREPVAARPVKPLPPTGTATSAPPASTARRRPPRR